MSREEINPFGDAGLRYHGLGYQPFPVVGKAGNIPIGVTGAHGRTVSQADVVTWQIDGRARDNIALRLTDLGGGEWRLVGIDVDAYSKGDTTKTGDHTLALAEAEWGELPPTWRSSARGASNPSGVRLYRAPAGAVLESFVNMVDGGAQHGDIEVIQHHHRYMVVGPSMHPDTGARYQWYSPDGSPVELPPEPLDLPELPSAWVEGLRRTRSDGMQRQGPAAVVAEQHAPFTQWDKRVKDKLQEALDDLGGPAGSRHDRTAAHVTGLCRLEERRVTGATSALEQLRGAFVDAVADSRGSEAVAEREFDKMLEWSRYKVASTLSHEERNEQVAAVLDRLPAPAAPTKPTLTLGHLLDSVEPVAAPEATAPEPVADDVNPAVRLDLLELLADADADVLRQVLEEATDDNPFPGFGPWGFVDIRKYLGPDWEPERPSLFTRTDGRSLFYRRNVNWLYGQAGEGKTWAALVCAAQEIMEDRHVGWIHFEDPEADKLVDRLVKLSVPPERIHRFFHVCVVDSHSLQANMPLIRYALGWFDCGLVVIDSVGEALGADGIPLKDDERLVQWLHRTSRTLAGDGFGVVPIDHLPIDAERRMDPVGSFRKKAAVTGSMLLAYSDSPPTKEKTGVITLRCAKDRGGFWERGTDVAEIVLTPGPDGTVDAAIEPPGTFLARSLSHSPTTPSFTSDGRPQPMGEQDLIVNQLVRAVVAEPGIDMSEVRERLDAYRGPRLDDAIDVAVGRQLIQRKQGSDGFEGLWPVGPHSV